MMNFKGRKLARISVTHYVSRSDLIQAAGELISEGYDLWDKAPKYVKAMTENRVRQQLFARGTRWEYRPSLLSEETKQYAERVINSYYPDLEKI